MKKSLLFLGLLAMSGLASGPSVAAEKGKVPYFENEDFESNFQKGISESVTLHNGKVIDIHDDFTWDWSRSKKPAPPVPQEAAASQAPDAPVDMPKTAKEAVEVWDTTFNTGEVDDTEAVRLYIHYKNNTPKKVVGVSISVKVTNAFGKLLYEFSKDDEVVLQPQEQMKNDTYYVWKYKASSEGESPYDLMWQSAKKGTGKVEVTVRKVVFADGTSLGNGAKKKKEAVY